MADQPTDPNIWTKQQKLDQYKMLFDQWQATRTERTQYNKWYTNLLVVSLFLVVFSALAPLITAIVGAKGTIVSVDLIRGLLTLIFIAGAVISLSWFLKLYSLKVLALGQLNALTAAEAAGLSPFCAVSNEVVFINNYVDAETTINKKKQKDVVVMAGAGMVEGAIEEEALIEDKVKRFPA